MDGVQVLSTKNVFVINRLGIVLLIALAITFVLLFIVVAKAKEPLASDTIVWVVILFGMAATFLMLIFMYGNRKTLEYKAIVDEDLSYNDLTSEYYVLDEDGLIYTLAEKGED